MLQMFLFVKKCKYIFFFIVGIFVFSNLVFASSIEIVSVSSNEELGNDTSQLSADFRRPISADGRYVAFQSKSSNLVPSDTNNTRDIFVRDRELRTTERVSVDSLGVEGNGFSSNPSLSSNGRYVVFESLADNLVPNDTNSAQDIFIHDRETGVTERVSVNSAEVESNDNSLLASVSAGGRYVAFQSSATNLVSGDTNNSHDVFVRDRELGTTERISISNLGIEGNRDSIYPMISDDGRFVAFQSFSSNLIAGTISSNIFVYDRDLNSLEVVSVSSLGQTGNDVSEFPFISGSGRYVAFQSYATNLVSGDNNNDIDLFFHDRQTGVTKKVSVNLAGGNSEGVSGNISISSNGKYTTFWSTADSLILEDNNDESGHLGVMAVNFFLHNTETGETQIISRDARHGLLSSDGNAVIFEVADLQIEGDNNGFYDIAILVLDPVSTDDQSGSGSIGFSVAGCTNPLAVNYNPNAIVENESCIFDNSSPDFESNIFIPGKFEIDDGGIAGEVKGFVNEVRSDVSDVVEKLPKGFIRNTSFLGLVFPALASFVLPSQKILGTVFHFLNLLLMMVGFQKKKKSWGVVYDSATKKPIISASVSLQNNEGQEIYTTKTDFKGQFNFSPEPGQYHLVVRKDGYQFPSNKLTGEYDDGKYDNLYFSGEFNVTSKDEMIYKNIPLDAISFDWSQYIKSEIQKTTSFQFAKNGFWQDFSTAIFFVGGVASVVACIVSPSALNLTITGLYLTLLVLGMGMKTKTQ